MMLLLYAICSVILIAILIVLCVLLYCIVKELKIMDNSWRWGVRDDSDTNDSYGKED